MIYRTLGRTDLRVSAIGLGCQSLGGGLFHRDDSQSERVLAEAVERGVTFFDVSDHHSLGAAERLLGRCLGPVRDKVIITSKAGYDYAPLTRTALRLRDLVRPISAALKPARRSLHKLRLAQGRFSFDPDYIVRSVERSLERLRTDRLDLFQFYKPPAEALRDGRLYDAAERLKRQGKIRHYGVACLHIEDAMAALEHDGNATVQLAINCLEQKGVPELIDAAQARGVAVLARHPKAIGLLTNDHDDLMGDSSAYRHDQAERMRAARQLRALIREDRTLAQAAIRFVLDMPGVDIVVPRAVTVDQLRENVGSIEVPPLSDSDRQCIEAVRRQTDGLQGPVRHAA